jgi:hypothetical protein
VLNAELHQIINHQSSILLPPSPVSRTLAPERRVLHAARCTRHTQLSPEPRMAGI